MDLDYQQKYLKYKKKYLDLKYKEYSGGGFLDFIFNPKKFNALKKIKKDGLELNNFKELQNDKEVVLAAVQQNGLALEFASDKLKADRKVVLAAVQQNGNALKLASQQLKNDRELVSYFLDNQ